MTFYINECSLQFHTNNSQLQLFRQIIFTVIIFQLCSVMVLRIMSGLKNYDLHMIRKQLQEKQKIEEKAIFETMQNLNLNELSQHNQTIMTLVNNTKPTNTKMKILKKDSINPIDTIVLNKSDKTLNLKRMEYKNEQNISEQSNSSDQSQATQHNGQEDKDSSTVFENDSEMLINQIKNFINVFNIKLNQSEASNFFNIILGHFFISAALALHHSPSIYSALFSSLHVLLFVFLLIVNACVNETKNQVANQVDSSKDNIEHQRNPSAGLILDRRESAIGQSSIHESEKLQQKSLKRKISLLIMAFMVFINLSLLTYTITQIKQSYFNVQQNSCQ